MIRETDPKAIPPEISKRNWIFCRDKQDDFDKAIKETHKTIRTDFEWVRFHTDLLVKAKRWEQKQDNSQLLRGKELRDAEQRIYNSGDVKFCLESIIELPNSSKISSTAAKCLSLFEDSVLPTVSENR